MTAIIQGFTSVIQFLKDGFQWIQNLFQAMAYALQYVTQTINMEKAIILQMPNWIQGFLIISMCMAIALIIAGRYRG